MNLKANPVFRVVFESREIYRVIDEYKNLYQAELAGRMRLENRLWPAVGDWVIGEPQPGGWVLITEVCPRSSSLERRDPEAKRNQVLAANVDILFIVTSANQDLNLKRLDRYVIMASAGRVKPVILINKIELAQDAYATLDEVAGRFADIDVVGVSAVEGWNLNALEDYAQPGSTVAFVGSSGVGKSTLCNFLLGRDSISTQEIREDNDRGRHTTTHRELHVTHNGAAIVDTPGIRTVGLSDDADLNAGFSDVIAFFDRCRFKDCGHQTEPKCAVRSALASGELSDERWQSYLKLERELAFAQRRKNKALQSAEKKKWAKIHVANRQRDKWRRK